MSQSELIKYCITKKPQNIVLTKIYSFAIPFPSNSIYIKFDNTIFEQEIHYKLIYDITLKHNGLTISSISGEQLYQNYLISGTHIIPFPNMTTAGFDIEVTFKHCSNEFLYTFHDAHNSE